MAKLRINAQRILDNIGKLNAYLSRHDIAWTLVAKVLSGHSKVLDALLHDEAFDGVHSMADARLSGVRAFKESQPDIRTMYLKPPAVNLADEVVEFADVSLNTSLTTIRALNKAAATQHKVHQVIIMVEMGELREGIIRDQILDFYAEVFDLSHINVIGLGTNLGCMHGVEPDYDKMVQLCLYRKLIEAQFDRSVPFISGSSSISLPLVGTGRLPAGVNHLRIGESAFFGVSPLNNESFRDLSTEVFDFTANIIEKARKDRRPDGTINDASIGRTVMPEDGDGRKGSDRCIVDFGILDVDVDHIKPKDEGVQFAGTTSDMTVYDVDRSGRRYNVGDELHFTPDYMAVARLMHSKYITKEVEVV